jgi:hypothetical protein
VVPAVARICASIASSDWTPGAGHALARDQAGHWLGAVDRAREAQAGAGGGEVGFVVEQVELDRGQLARVGRFQRDPAARLRVEQDHVGAEGMLGALDEPGKPQVRAELHRVREQLDVGLREPPVGAQHRVGAVELARERPGAEQVPLRHGSDGAVEAQLVDEGNSAFRGELERHARVLGEVAADAGEVVNQRDAHFGEVPGRPDARQHQQLGRVVGAARKAAPRLRAR